MKLVKADKVYFLVGKTPCAICENPVEYKLTLKLAEHYLTSPICCEDCDPILKLTKDEGMIVTRSEDTDDVI